LIIDTTYLLPLAGIGVRMDLLRAVVEGRVKGVVLDDLALSLISIFELQAKSAKLNIPVSRVVEAVRVITSSFRVIPFHTQPIIEHAFELRGILGDYIDCIIVATAVSLGEDLVTEDTRILSQRKVLEEKYEIKIHSYKDLVI
jgi:predicted nucleic acid-binding protein